MARKKKKRSHASYVRAGKKAARTRKRKRRRNPTRHRVVVYATGRGKKKRLRRSPSYRLKPRRVNPKRRRRRSYRRNPVRLRRMGQRYFGKARMQNAIMLLVGIGGSAALKGIIAGFAPVGVMRDWLQRLYGGLSIIAGVTLQMRSRRKAVKSAGMGMVVYGLYDLIVSNTPLGAYLPTIGAPTAFTKPVSGYQDFGQLTYPSMGASFRPGGSTEVVGGNITGGEMPEVIGEDLDLADALEMAA